MSACDVFARMSRHRSCAAQAIAPFHDVLTVKLMRPSVKS